MARSEGHIDISHLGLDYEVGSRRTAAVADISLAVLPGEFISIVGPSGCGKSTLLNVVAGFITPTRGRVRLDGEIIRGPGADRGMVFQHSSLFPWKTVLGNVEFGLKMKGIGVKERRRMAHTLLSLAGLAGFEGQFPDRLSGGMQQRVGIVRALATGPRVLLMDEPFGALDAQTREIMQQILTNIWERLGISVLFVTHDVDEAIFLSDRVYVMTARPGRLKAEMPIGLKRPRERDGMVSQEFLELRGRLASLVREESLRAMGGELASDLGGLEAMLERRF